MKRVLGILLMAMAAVFAGQAQTQVSGSPNSACDESAYEQQAQQWDKWAAAELDFHFSGGAPQIEELSDRFKNLAAASRELAERCRRLKAVSSLPQFISGLLEMSEKEKGLFELHRLVSELFGNQATYWFARSRYWSANISPGKAQGERMKTALARAILHSPRNLLLDEPTNGLDVPTVRSLRAILRRLRDAGACLVFSSHVLDEVCTLCDQIIVISEGKLAAQGTPSELCAQTNTASMEEAFVKLTSTHEESCLE